MGKPISNVPSVEPEPQQAQENNATETPDAPAVAPSDPASSSAEGANAPKKRHLLIPIPSRRSSKVNKAQGSEKTEEAQDEPSRRGSKVSILRSKRDQSRASSRRSRQTQDGANVEESKEVATVPEGSPSKPQQKKGPSKLLAFLGCCSSSEVDTDDAALPAKKTTMRPPTSNRLPTPDKAEAHTGDSSTVESREPYLDEKANSTISADQPGEEDRNVKATVASVQEEGPAHVTKAEASGQKDQSEDAALPAQTGPEAKSDANNQREGQSTSTTDELTPASASTMPKTLGSDGADGEEKLTPQQEVAPTVVMPPPPPPPLPPAPPAPAPPAQGYSEDAAHPLLPPVLPHLQGRKCLVLDLDETLVHSSFKVSSCHKPAPRVSHRIVSLTSHTGFGTCRLYNPS